MKVKLLSLTLSDPMDCSLPRSSAHGIFQARVLEWDAIAELGVRVLFRHCILSSLNISPSSHLIFFSLKTIPQVGENFIEMDTLELSFQDLTYH